MSSLRSRFFGRLARLLAVLCVPVAFSMAMPAVAFASFEYHYPNGDVVTVSDDMSTITGTCSCYPAALVGGTGYNSTYFGVTLPGGDFVTGYCLESFFGDPGHDMYPAPSSGTYAFTATRDSNGDYSFVIHTENAPGVAGFSSAIAGNWPRQRVYVPPRRIVIAGKFELSKQTTNRMVSRSNRMYSMDGAVFAIYANRTDAIRGRNPEYTFTISDLHSAADGSGVAGKSPTIDGLTPGKHWLKELQTPPGFEPMDPNPMEIDIQAGQLNAYVVAEHVIVVDPPKFEKNDAASHGALIAEGDSTVSGAWIEIRYYDKPLRSKEAVAAEGPATRTWYLRTGEDGAAIFDTSHFIEEASDPLFMDNGAPTIPLGTLVVSEVSAPEGYRVNDDVGILVYENADDHPTVIIDTEN